MNSYCNKQKRSIWYRALCGFIAFTFIFTMILPPQVSAQIAPTTVLNLPAPGVMISQTAAFMPATLTGINLYPDNPLKFDFIVDKGDTELTGEAFESESEKLIKYFLAALTVPEDEVWVNLSPYEKDRIIPNSFGQTEMGRDLLAQDYLLKQLSASLMYPENDLGQTFWNRVHERAMEEFGAVDIPMNTFNKIWIVPQEASVYEHAKGAVVVKSYLKVMLEEDYLALETNVNSTKHGLGDVSLGDVEVISGVQSQIVREILIPEIEKEVNEGETFANLRQIYNSVILATWYKQSLKKSLLGQVYVDQNKTEGINIDDPSVNVDIYNQYVKAFETGVYNYIKEDYDPNIQETIPRKYFSGGAEIGLAEGEVALENASSPVVQATISSFGDNKVVTAEVKPIGVEFNDSGSVRFVGAPVIFEGLDVTNTIFHNQTGKTVNLSALSEEGSITEIKDSEVWIMKPNAASSPVIYSPYKTSRKKVRISTELKAGGIIVGVACLFGCGGGGSSGSSSSDDSDEEVDPVVEVIEDITDNTTLPDGQVTPVDIEELPDNVLDTAIEVLPVDTHGDLVDAIIQEILDDAPEGTVPASIVEFVDNNIDEILDVGNDNGSIAAYFFNLQNSVYSSSLVSMGSNEDVVSLYESIVRDTARSAEVRLTALYLFALTADVQAGLSLLSDLENAGTIDALVSQIPNFDLLPQQTQDFIGAFFQADRMAKIVLLQQDISDVFDVLTGSNDQFLLDGAVAAFLERNDFTLLASLTSTYINGGLTQVQRNAVLEVIAGLGIESNRAFLQTYDPVDTAGGIAILDLIASFANMTTDSPLIPYARFEPEISQTVPRSVQLAAAERLTVIDPAVVAQRTIDPIVPIITASTERESFLVNYESILLRQLANSTNPDLVTQVRLRIYDQMQRYIDDPFYTGVHQAENWAIIYAMTATSNESLVDSQGVFQRLLRFLDLVNVREGTYAGDKFLNPVMDALEIVLWKQDSTNISASLLINGAYESPIIELGAYVVAARNNAADNNQLMMDLLSQGFDIFPRLGVVDGLAVRINETLEVGGDATEDITLMESIADGLLDPDVKVQGRAQEALVDAGLRSSSPISRVAISEKDPAVGGIDLNPNEIDMKVERENGVGVIIPKTTPAQLNRLGNVQGFAPVILNVAPVINLPLLIGLDSTAEDKDQDVSYLDVDPMGRKARLDV